MNKKHMAYATAAVLLIGGGTLSAVALTSDDRKHHSVTVEATTEAVTEAEIENNASEHPTTEAQTSVNKDDTKDDKKDDKKNDNQTTSASTAEISSNITSESNGNSSVSVANNGTTAPSGNGNTSGNSGSGSSGNGGSTGNGNPSGNGGSGNEPSGPVTPAHTHDWQPVYKTIHHDEVSHTERVEVTPAYDDEVYASGTKCGKCGYKFTENFNALQVTENGDHICPSCGTELEYTGFSTGTILVETIHHDAVYEDKKIIDKAAEDETVVDYYKCSCGETKK